LIRRWFSILALGAGLILVASFVSAVVAPGLGRVHLAEVALGATLVVYASATVAVGLMGQRVETIAGRLGLPDWVEAQAEKNRRKVLQYDRVGLPLIGLTVLSDVLLVEGPTYLGLQAFTLAFQLGAFFGMNVVIVAQGRLLSDVRGWADSVDPVSTL
jgi:hypothetical protein